MNLKMTAAACVVMGLLTGCNDKEAPAPEPTPKQSQSEPTPAAAPEKPAQVIDTSVPLNQYQDLAGNNGQPLTYLVLAKAPGATTEDKMGYLSADYLATSDAFKRKDIEAAQWPGFEASLKSYAANDYYSLPISGFGVSNVLSMQNVSVGPYDFSTQSFPLTSYGQYCWANPVRNAQGMNLQVKPSAFPCSLQVKDSAQARMIEEARAKGSLDLRGTLYLYIPEADGNTAVGQVVRGSIDLVDQQTNQVMANFTM
ncbi:hypothetical protein [Pseudomonas putida]|uniref:Lipoprotein n=1 Tax=Pseudomonas putida (strain DOT-T1E) TaxID=1196325 RepID=G0WPH9_PSEPT|nr:hypothetical protein [Pseudomonas putida]AEK25449.1 Hypothetical protein [Pseudomonas putida DOT-T1E]UZM96817.1 hypothetical protein OPZ46_29660 [Pseudomonas putida DOT-T1E]